MSRLAGNRAMRSLAADAWPSAGDIRSGSPGDAGDRPSCGFTPGNSRAQQVVQAAVADVGQLTEGIAGQPHKAASPSLAHYRGIEHAAERLALALRDRKSVV